MRAVLLFFSFLCGRGIEGSSIVDFLVHTEDGLIAIEAKRPIVPIRRNLYRMANRVGEQVIKAERNLPKGVKQRVWIDNRTQGLDGQLKDAIIDKISKKSDGIVNEAEVRFVVE
jgi:hypothetical protein